MTPDYESIGQLLEQLAPHGIYSIDLIEDQFPLYGFTYDKATGKLSYETRSTRLYPHSKQELRRIVESDPKGGLFDPSVSEETLMVDALEISEAVYTLLRGPNDGPPPSYGYHGRGKGYRANVNAIREIEVAANGGI